MKNIDLYPIGTRVRATDKCGIAAPGEHGTVTRCDALCVGVQWDDGCFSSVGSGTDPSPYYEVIEPVLKPPNDPVFVGDSGWRA